MSTPWSVSTVMEIAVVVASYKRPGCLRRCLASLAIQRRPADEVIVVGQGDDEETVRVYGRFAGKRWRYLHIPEVSIAAAENEGVAAATADVVAFIDDDAEAGTAWLQRLHVWYREEEVGGVGGTYVEHEGETPVIAAAAEVGVYKWFGRYVSRQWCFTPGPRYVDVLSGSNMSFRRELIPPLPSALRPYWHAFEVFICGAVRKQGYRIVFDPRAYVKHFRGSGPRRYTFAYRSEDDLRRRLYRDNAHNFIFSSLYHDIPPCRTAFLLYEFLMGDGGRPGLGRAALMVLGGKAPDARLALGPSLRGRWEGLMTYLNARKGGGEVFTTPEEATCPRLIG